MFRGCRFSALLLLGFVLCLPGFGQMAQVTGRVTDASQAVIPQASITITNEQTAIQYHAQTNATGYYTVPQLKPGVYRVEVQAPGFRSETHKGIELAVEP